VEVLAVYGCSPDNMLETILKKRQKELVRFVWYGLKSIGESVPGITGARGLDLRQSNPHSWEASLRV
jgi:hypothetical protein